MKTTIETYCPIFTGFYNTIWDESDRALEYELDNESDFREHYPELETVPWEYIKENAWDTVDYRAGSFAVSECVAEKLASFFKDLLPEEYSGMITDSRYQKLVSPREYNFANDGIDVEIDVDLELLHKYLKANCEALESYLKRRYTSRDGFMSSYPNDAEGWEDETNDFTKLDGHYLGSILQFIAENEDDDCEMSFYYHCDTYEPYMNAAYIQGDKLLKKWEAEKEFKQTA